MRFTAKKYLKALEEILSTLSEAEVNDFLFSLEEFNRAFRDKEVSGFFLHPEIKISDKQSLLEKTLHSLLASFLLTLLANKDLNKLELILSDLKNVYYDQIGKVVVSCESKRDLAEAEKKTLSSLLKNYTRKDPVMTFSQNDQLIGGIRLRLKKEVLEANWQNDLKCLEELI